MAIALPPLQSRHPKTVKKPIHILIADRNPHVRRFLQRELQAEGYRVFLAQNGQEILNVAFTPLPLDLVVLDPDFPDTDSADLLSKLRDRIPPLPLVIHSFLTEDGPGGEFPGADAFIEKGANSIEQLKRYLAEKLPAS